MLADPQKLTFDSTLQTLDVALRIYDMRRPLGEREKERERERERERESKDYLISICLKDKVKWFSFIDCT